MKQGQPCGAMHFQLLVLGATLMCIVYVGYACIMHMDVLC